MKKRRWYLDAALVVIVVILAVLVYFRLEKVFVAWREEPSPEETTAPALTITEIAGTERAEFGADVIERKTAKDFELQSLSDETVSLSDYKGQPILVNFWATWCPPCKQEMPLLQAAADQYGEDLVILAINGGDTMDQIREFVEANGYDMIFLADPENLTAPEYLVRGFPTTFFINVEGLIEATHVGMLDESLLSGYLQEIGIAE